MLKIFINGESGKMGSSIIKLIDDDDSFIKVEKGDLIMFDNHRTLHGRTSFDQNEGKRFLKGCYIDHDSTEGKLRFLERKFNLKWKK